MVREILGELDARGDAGARVQHQIVRELAAMRSVADPVLSVRVPTRQLVTTAPRYGIGVIARNGRSLAVIEPPFARPRSTVPRSCRFK